VFFNSEVVLLVFSRCSNRAYENPAVLLSRVSDERKKDCALEQLRAAERLIDLTRFSRKKWLEAEKDIHNPTEPEKTFAASPQSA
jgi:hypothetical protein